MAETRVMPIITERAFLEEKLEEATNVYDKLCDREQTLPKGVDNKVKLGLRRMRDRAGARFMAIRAHIRRLDGDGESRTGAEHIVEHPYLIGIEGR